MVVKTQAWKSYGESVVEGDATDTTIRADIRAQRFIFTGRSLCTFSSALVQDAVREIGESMGSDRFSGQLVTVETDMSAENWKNSSLGYYDRHTIVLITDNVTGQKVYFDPTYGQVDHRWAGRGRTMQEDELKSCYRMPGGDYPYPTPENTRAMSVEFYMSRLGILKDNYKRLVGALTGQLS